jgi:uncharacterized protein YlxW (UPF0749 family)
VAKAEQAEKAQLEAKCAELQAELTSAQAKVTSLQRQLEERTTQHAKVRSCVYCVVYCFMLY